MRCDVCHHPGNNVGFDSRGFLYKVSSLPAPNQQQSTTPAAACSNAPAVMPRWNEPVGRNDHRQQQQEQQQQHLAGLWGSHVSTGAEEAKGSSAVASSTPVFQDDLDLDMLHSLKLFAQGGFCAVYSCVYLNEKAVLKIPKSQGPERAVADLLVEISIYRRLAERGGHANITRAFGAGFHLVEGKSTPFLVLELLEGGSLAAAIERSRPQGDDAGFEEWIDPVPRLPAALELADAMHFLHFEAVPSGFVLHRDLKPTNIGLCSEGHVKVFDLGLSVIQEVREGNMDKKYEMPGMAGSKRFMSPEVCNGLPYNEKVDVYSFAIVLWELCSLRKPFQGMSVADHFREVITGGLRPPLDPRWPAELQHLLQACWHEDPDQRPSFLEAREVLRRILWTVHGGG